MSDTGATAIPQDNLDTTVFQDYCDRILKQARRSMNDRRFASYVRYVNEFLKFFGTEKCFLVGSCAEVTKLTWSKDDGDADFLMVSGKLTVPVEEIVSRLENPNFVWIRGEHLDIDQTLKVDLIEGSGGKKYLPASVLRDVDPRLFTFIRGMLKVISVTSDTFPMFGTRDRKTTTGATSKVGLERTNFRKLTIVDKEKIPQLRKYFTSKTLPSRKGSQKAKQLSHGYKFESLRKGLELFALFSVGGPTSERHSHFDHFTDVVKLLLDRWKAEREPITIMPIEGDCSDDRNADCAYNVGGENTGKLVDKTETVDGENVMNYGDIPSGVKATYKEKFMIDFVPALRIEGKPKCMEDWYHRDSNWPSKTLKDEIYNSDCYVIAKTPPFEEDQRNFCLAFNHAELKLAKSWTPTQQKCYLLLKAYHKGIFVKTMEKIPTKQPLKTFHLKTVFYWVLESTGDTSIWWDENLIEALRNVLMYLQDSLKDKRLSHYFTGANLFLGFETEICSALVANIDEILERPTACLQSFFDLENQRDIEVILIDDQVKCLIDMSRDGGLENEANVIEDCMEDFMRGFEDAPKDENGDVPLKQAMNHVMQVMLEEKAKQRLEKALIRKQRAQCRDATKTPPSSGSGRFAEAVSTLGTDLPTSGEKNEEKKETKEALHQELGQQLAQTASAFIFQPTQKDMASLEGNLKQKGLKYFREESLD